MFSNSRGSTKSIEGSSSLSRRVKLLNMARNCPGKDFYLFALFFIDE